jgi:AAA domain
MRTVAQSVVTATTPRPVSPAAAPHHTEQTLAAALFAAWTGDPAVVVASPPGAGKTRLVVHLADQLHRRAGLDVAIAAQTRAQALDVTNRAAAIGAQVGLLGSKDAARPLGLDPRARFLAGARYLHRKQSVVVATTARWLWVKESDYTADVCLVDESWQLTYADLGALGPLSDQVVLVGDPGQIAPVVTGDARRWQTWATGPQRAAPEALLAAYPNAVTRLQLCHTWRLGPQTTALIQPTFYAELPFTSVRPPRHIALHRAVLSELSVRLVAPLGGPGDPAIAAAAADRVRELLGGGQVVAGLEEAPLQPDQVAVITPHVEQASAIAARLADLPSVLIGTANQTQGLEREAVVVVHPLVGYRDAPAFAVDTGRLCVALSRHRAHATVLLDASTDAVLRRAQADSPGDTTLGVQRHVLAALLALA